MNDMKMIKKVITMVMVVALVAVSALSGFTLSSVDVQAAPKKNSGTTDNGKWKYKYYKSTKSVGLNMIYKKLKKDGTTLTFPNTVKIDKKSYKVTRILDYQFYNEQEKKVKESDWEEYVEDNYFKKVVIPSNVQVIEEDAFCYGSKLKEVQFAKNGNLKTIDEEAFSCCNLRKVTIPASVTKIGEWAFSENLITEVTLERTSKLNIVKNAFEDNAIGYECYDSDYEPDQCVLKVPNYDVYKWANTSKVFGTDVIVKSAKTRLFIDSKKYVDINVGYNGSTFDITKYITIDKKYDYLGATLEYANRIFNSSNIRTIQFPGAIKVKSNAYPLIKIKKLNLMEKVYYVETNGFAMLEVDNRTKYFDKASHTYTIGMFDSMSFYSYPSHPDFVKKGYHIDGYLLEGPGLKTTVFKAGARAKSLTDKQGATIKAKLHYVPNKYQVNYDLNGGEGNIASTPCTYDDESLVTSAVPTRDKYRFLGWSKSADDATNLYHANDIIDNWTSKQDGAVTLYAQWEKIKKKIELEISADELSEGEEAEEYMVSYTVNGELVYDRSHTVVGDEPIKITIPDLYEGDVVEVTASGLLTDEDRNSLESEKATATIVVK